MITRVFRRHAVAPSRALSRSCRLFNKNDLPSLETMPVTRSNKKKKATIQKLRRSDPRLHNQSSILSLLNKPTKTLEKYLSPVTAVTVGDSIVFDKAIPAVSGYECTVLVPDEVINIRFQGKDLMILSNGTLVGWDILEEDILKNVLPILQLSLVIPCDPESDEMDWIELEQESTNTTSYLQGEIMVLQGETEEKKLLDKAAFAIGLLRSTRLAVLEDIFEKHLQLTKNNAEYLLNGQPISTTEAEFLKLTGRLFLLRGKLNLYSELIETPDLYWSEPTLEKIYNLVLKVLDINSRISILNRKLDYATEEQRAFLLVLNEKKGTRLEWIIIILIMVEVGFETFHFYERSQKEKDE